MCVCVCVCVYAIASSAPAVIVIAFRPLLYIYRGLAFDRVVSTFG